MDEVLSQRFGGFVLLRRLGAGRVTEVFRARLAVAGQARPLAIQRTLPAVARDEAFVAAWQEAAVAASRLSHVNVTRVFEAGQADGVPFVAMELVEGVSLAQVSARAAAQGRVLTPAQAAHIGAGVAAGLQHIHGRAGGDDRLEPAHLGVSPRSVLLTWDGEVKLTDLGMARALEQLTSDEVPTAPSRAYTSPEHMRGDAVDPRSDLFSLGIVLWELLAQRPLFRADDPWEARRGVLEGDIPLLRAVTTGVPEDLERLVFRMLRRGPGERPPSAAGVATALERVRAAAGGGAPDGGLSALLGELFADERARADEVHETETEAWLRAIDPDGPPPPPPIALASGAAKAETPADTAPTEEPLAPEESGPRADPADRPAEETPRDSDDPPLDVIPLDPSDVTAIEVVDVPGPGASAASADLPGVVAPPAPSPPEAPPQAPLAVPPPAPTPTAAPVPPPDPTPPPAAPPVATPPGPDEPDDFSDLALMEDPHAPPEEAPSLLDADEEAATTSNVGAWLVVTLLVGIAAALVWYYLQIR